MIKEEQILKSRYGTQSPFRVPEGYFDELASRVMASVPESQPALDMQSESASQGARIVPMWRRAVVRKVAVIAGVVLFVGRSFHRYRYFSFFTTGRQVCGKWGMGFGHAFGG